MVIEFLAVKGFAAICSFVAHHAVATKVAVTGYKLLNTYSLAQIAAGVATASVVVGGVVWGVDRINNLKNGYNAIIEGDKWKAIRNFGELALSIGGVHTLPEAVQSGLTQLHVSSEHAQSIANWVSTNENAIINYVNSHR